MSGVRVFAEDNIPAENVSKVPKVALTSADLEEFSKRMSAFVDSLKEITDKLSPPVEEPEEVKETIWQRLADNNFRDMFVGRNVTADDTDSVVNTVTLMNALIMTIPYSIMSSANHEYWEWVKATLDACPTTKFRYSQNFGLFNSTMCCVMFSTIICLVLAMLYYLLKPRSEKKFRHWWKYSRYVVVMTICGTVCSVVSLIVVCLWMFAWYSIPEDEYCDYTSIQPNIIGITITGIILLLSLFLMM